MADPTTPLLEIPELLELPEPIEPKAASGPPAMVVEEEFPGATAGDTAVWLGVDVWSETKYPTSPPTTRAASNPAETRRRRCRLARATMARSSSGPGSAPSPSPRRSWTGMSSGSIPLTKASTLRFA
jgi:hypothetical protein